MKLRSESVLSTAILAALAGTAHGQATTADNASAKATTLEEVLVVAQRANRSSTGATNLNLEIKDTPQSVSVINQVEMDQFGVDNINDALKMATGIQVEEVSTNSTQYLSRGFEIKNTQIDGVGLPNGWGIVTNSMDSYGFEKIEVIRGANGLLTGVGNAAGTINYVRKRPTNEAQGQIGVTFGSFDRRRIEADYSTPFNESGTWAGRAVAAREEKDSHLRDFHEERTYAYGVVDGQIGENGALAIGYSYQQVDTDHNMWGALTFSGNDGSQLEFDRGASTTQDWTWWNSRTDAGFVEYTHRLSDTWQVKASYNYRKFDHDSELFLGYSPTGLDPVTGEGMYGWAYKSPYSTKANIVDLTIGGKYQLFGREQEVMFGASSGKSQSVDYYNPTDFSNPLFGELPPFPFDGTEIPEPVFASERQVYNTLNQRLDRVFGATHLSLTDRLSTIIGFNWAQYHREGMDNERVRFDQSDSDIAPYAGVTFDFTDRVTGYVNYSYIYQPQEYFDFDRNYFAPSKGSTYEVGVKAEWLDKRLLTTLAVFKAEQKTLATYAGTSFRDGYAFGYYNDVDVDSTGVEFEASGKINEYTNLVVGYTQLKMDGPKGSDTYAWVPRRTANLTLSSRLPSFMPLAFGINARWQSEVSNEDSYSGYTVRQDSYGWLNAFASWEVVPNVTVRGNVNNITDEKYITSLYDISYYSAPRTYAMTVDYRF